MIDITAPAPDAATIDPEALEAARRYIAVIVARDPLAVRLGPDWTRVEAARLLDRFLERYAEVATGPYARPRAEAVRVALSSL